MLGRLWNKQEQALGGLFCALGLIGSAAVSYGVGEVLGANGERQEHAPYYTERQTKAQVVETCELDRVEDPIECAFDEAQTYAKDRYADQDLQAQRTMALWAAIVGLIGILQLFVSGVGLMALLKTIRQGHEGLSKADDANRIAREESRAWLRFEPSPAGTLCIKPDEMTFEADVTVENHGGSPALDVSCFAKITYSSPTRAEIESLALSPYHTPEHGVTVAFPGKPEMTGVNTTVPGARPHAARIFVTIVTRYRILGDDGWHFTAFTFETVPDSLTRLYGMEGDRIVLQYGDNITQSSELTLKKGKAGLPIAT